VNRRSGHSLCATQKSAFHTTSVGHTKGKGATTTIYCRNTSSGKHRIGSQKKQGKKSAWSPTTSVFCQRGAISNEAKVSALSETRIQCFYNSTETLTVFCGPPNHSDQQSATIQYIEQSFSNRTCLLMGNRAIALGHHV
jgi:hypothetical protein